MLGELTTINQHLRSNRFSSVFVFLLPLGLFRLFDSILSYIFPILLESHVESKLFIGATMALTSLVGLICDFVLPQLFPNKSWKIFLITGMIIAGFFPFLLLLGDLFALTSLFILGVIVWGIYYEFILFAEQNFVIKEFKQEEYSKTWGIIGIMLDTISIVAPIIGSILLITGIFTYSIVTTSLLIIAFMFAIFILKKEDLKEENKTRSKIKRYVSFLREFKYWRSLSSRIIPLLIMAFLLELVSATFWVFGGLFGRELIGIPGLDWGVLAVSSVPTLIGSIIISRLKIKRRKKLLSQLCILIAGLILIPFALLEGNVSLTLITIFIASLVLSFSWPLNDAVYSDLQYRLKKKGIHLMGLSNASYSIAFIITPILVGYLLDKVGYHQTYTILGVTLFISASLLILFTPKKLRMPHKTLEVIK